MTPLTEEQLEYARAAARKLPPLTKSQRDRLAVLDAQQDRERERRMQAAYVATMSKREPDAEPGRVAE